MGHFVAAPRRRRREEKEDEEDGVTRANHALSWNRTHPLFLKEITRGGSMRNHLFLAAIPKEDAIRNHLFLTENALPQLPSVFEGKDCSDAAPCILDRNTASMQLRRANVMPVSRSIGGVTDNALRTK